MSNYRNRETGNVLNGREVKLLHKNTSFTATTFNDLGYDPVFHVPQPAKSATYKVVYRDGVTQDGNGNWVEAWAERDMTQAEIDAYDLSQLPVVPESVDRFAAEYVLADTDHPSYPGNDEYSMLDRMNEVINAITPKKEKQKAQAEMKRDKWRRDSPLIAQLAPALPLTSQQLDDLFIAAKAVEQG